ncbi:hypothetical protein M153_1990005906 [Pseudoloma neurophilia]|uniref:Uncharacterized protein n=1 Tax=Pseudoloma neurophilia TaxID=146866 RepID=A0A0R0LZI9_9MICR|nr:hypothetical protein M153_1990005906 [Pseudoloma neurophilia]
MTHQKMFFSYLIFLTFDFIRNDASLVVRPRRPLKRTVIPSNQKKESPLKISTDPVADHQQAIANSLNDSKKTTQNHKRSAVTLSEKGPSNQKKIKMRRTGPVATPRGRRKVTMNSGRKRSGVHKATNGAQTRDTVKNQINQNADAQGLRTTDGTEKMTLNGQQSSNSQSSKTITLDKNGNNTDGTEKMTLNGQQSSNSHGSKTITLDKNGNNTDGTEKMTLNGQQSSNSHGSKTITLDKNGNKEDDSDQSLSSHEDLEQKHPYELKSDQENNFEFLTVRFGFPFWTCLTFVVSIIVFGVLLYFERKESKSHSLFE